MSAGELLDAANEAYVRVFRETGDADKAGEAWRLALGNVEEPPARVDRGVKSRAAAERLKVLEEASRDALLKLKANVPQAVEAIRFFLKPVTLRDKEGSVLGQGYRKEALRAGIWLCEHFGEAEERGGEKKRRSLEELRKTAQRGLRIAGRVSGKKTG